jgi:hypothetical protein
MHSLPAAKAVLSVERVIEHDDLAGHRRIAHQVREEKGKRKRRAVAGAERVLETWAIGGVLPSPTSIAVSLMTSW